MTTLSLELEDVSVMQRPASTQARLASAAVTQTWPAVTPRARGNKMQVSTKLLPLQRQEATRFLHLLSLDTAQQDATV